MIFGLGLYLHFTQIQASEGVKKLRIGQFVINRPPLNWPLFSSLPFKMENDEANNPSDSIPPPCPFHGMCGGIKTSCVAFQTEKVKRASLFAKLKQLSNRNFETQGPPAIGFY